jgi:hypothetical protein
MESGESEEWIKDMIFRAYIIIIMTYGESLLTLAAST